MTNQIRRWLPLLALFGVLLLLTLQPGAAYVQAAAQAADTPTPAPPTLTPKLGSVPITAQNAPQIKQLMQIGDGGAQNVCWSPDGNTLGVATTIGLRLYNAHNRSKASIPLGPTFNASACNWSPHSRYIALTNGQPSPAVPWQVSIWRVSDGTLFKAFNDASAVVWSPDGQSFLTTDSDKRVRLWNGVTGALLNGFDTTNAAWSPDSRFVAFIDISTGLHVWAGQSNSIVFSDTPGWVQFAWAPNSHWFAVRNNGGAVGLAAVDPQKPAIAAVTQLKQTGWNDMSWSPDSTRLVTGGIDGSMVIWNASDGSQKKILSIGAEVTAVTWSPTGKTIAIEFYNLKAGLNIFGHQDVAMELVDAQTGNSLFDPLADPLTVNGKMTWSPTGRFLVLDIFQEGTGNTSFDGIQIWPTTSTATVPLLSIDAGNAFSWSLNGTMIASITATWGGSPLACCRFYGLAQINDLSSGQYAPDKGVYLFGDTFTSSYIAWSPNGHYLSWEGTQWKVAEGTLDNSSGPDVCQGFTWGPDSDLFATYCENPMDTTRVLLQSYSTGDRILNIAGDDNNLFQMGGPSALAMSSNRDYLAFNDGNTFYVWSISTSTQFQKMIGHTDQINSLAFSPNSRLIASGSADSTIRIWSVGSGESLLILNGHTAAVNRVVWSPDGKQLSSASDDQTVRIWDASTGALLQTLKGHTDSVVSVQLSPDGKLLASASKDGTIRLWDAVHGTLLNTVRGHVGAINDLSWSPDGKTLATAGADATIRLWGIP